MKEATWNLAAISPAACNADGAIPLPILASSSTRSASDGWDGNTRCVAASLRFVYLLQSLLDPQQYYVGMTSSPAARLAAHNASESPHTTRLRSWRAPVTIEFIDQRRALAFERYLKSGSGREFARRHFR